MNMEILQEKAKLADERIQQLKTLISSVGTNWEEREFFFWNWRNIVGQLDPDVYVKVLQQENTRLKARVEGLVQELISLENQRGGSVDKWFVQ